MTTQRYFISLDGCDDTTEFEMDLTEAELVAIRKVSDKSRQVSNYSCMPTLHIKLVNLPSHD